MNTHPLTSERPYLETSLQAAKWIDQQRVVTEHGIRWRNTPDDDSPPASPQAAWSISAGLAGMVLFRLELYGATRHENDLKIALSGADHLVATLSFDGQLEIGLYGGLAGIAYALELTYQVSGRIQYREMALRCVAEIGRYVPAEKGKFFGQGNEIYSGRAGLALTLLWLYKMTRDPKALELALLAGKTVLERARDHDQGGMYWFTGDSNPEMPGFALGSAGMAYLMVVMYQETGERAYLDTAIAAVRRIQALAFTQGDGCLIDPLTIPKSQKTEDGIELYGPLIGWYQGAVGVWRPFLQLARVTRDREWSDWVHRLARGAMNRFPKPGDGTYENYKPSHTGNAQAAQSFLELHLEYGTPEYRTFAERLFTDIVRQGVVDDNGMHWMIFYNGQYLTSTCFGNGAAGVSTSLLHFDAFEQRRKPIVSLPDSGFGSALFSSFPG